MNNTTSHTKIKQLLVEIESLIPATHQHLLSELAAEVEQLMTFLPQASLTGEYIAKPEFDNATGCYRQGKEQVFYCPHCYESQQDLIATQRINSRLRVCPQCRSSIKPVK